MIIRTYAFLVVAFLAGCAHTGQHTEIQQLTYLADSREAFMLKFKPTGSPCLDALQINLANVGCPELQAWQGHDELLYFQCSNQPNGAADMWSTSVFVVVPIGSSQPPDYIRPICIDPMNALGVLEQA